MPVWSWSPLERLVLGKLVGERAVLCRLQKEVLALRKALDELRAHLLKSQLQLSELDHTLTILNTDIDVKDNTLLVDSNGLATLRQHIHVEPCIGVAFAMPRCQYDCLHPQKCFPDQLFKNTAN